MHSCNNNKKKRKKKEIHGVDYLNYDGLFKWSLNCRGIESNGAFQSKEPFFLSSVKELI